MITQRLIILKTQKSTIFKELNIVVNIFKYLTYLNIKILDLNIKSRIFKDVMFMTDIFCYYDARVSHLKGK